MGGGSAKPKRKKAAGSALRYEHRRGRADVGKPEERDFSCGLFCLVMVVFLALIVPMAMAMEARGKDVWGDLAPAWPGGAYAFAATVGACVPLAFAAFVAPLTRMKWRKSKARSLGWSIVSLPGLAAGWLIAGVILATWRPKRHRDWDSDCYSVGGPCWVHGEFPYLWAVGLVSTVAVAALLITLLVKYAGKASTAAEKSLDTTAT